MLAGERHIATVAQPCDCLVITLGIQGGARDNIVVRGGAQSIGITGLQYPAGDERCTAVAVLALQLRCTATGLMQLACTTDVSASRQRIGAINVEHAVINDIPFNTPYRTARAELQYTLFDGGATGVGVIQRQRQ